MFSRSSIRNYRIDPEESSSFTMSVRQYDGLFDDAANILFLPELGVPRDSYQNGFSRLLSGKHPVTLFDFSKKKILSADSIYAALDTVATKRSEYYSDLPLVFVTHGSSALLLPRFLNRFDKPVQGVYSFFPTNNLVLPYSDSHPEGIVSYSAAVDLSDSIFQDIPLRVVRSYTGDFSPVSSEDTHVVQRDAWANVPSLINSLHSIVSSSEFNRRKDSSVLADLKDFMRKKSIK